MDSQTFGEKIKALREEKGYSLQYAAELLEFSPKLLNEVEKNTRELPEGMVQQLAELYNFSYKELIIKYLSEKIYYQTRFCEYADEILSTVKQRLKKEGKGTQLEKSKDKIFESIKAYFANKPVEKAWVFGSFARNTSVSKDSDIDIMVVFKKPNKISLFDLIQMKEELTEKTGRMVDLVEEGQELACFKNTIKKERQLVYGG